MQLENTQKCKGSFAYIRQYYFLFQKYANTKQNKTKHLDTVPKAIVNQAEWLHT